MSKRHFTLDPDEIAAVEREAKHEALQKQHDYETEANGICPLLEFGEDCTFGCEDTADE